MILTKTLDDMEKTVVGAKKRKIYKQNKTFVPLPTSRPSKESTPADSGYIETIDLASSECSGTLAFKNEDFDIIDKILRELNEIKPKVTEKPAGSRRTARQAAILEKRSPTWHLQRAVVKYKLVRANETTEEAINRLLPQVSVIKLSKEQIKDLSRPWGFLNRTKIEDKYKFHSKIIIRRESPKTGAIEVLVEFFPSGILENAWMKSSDLPLNGVKVVDIQNLSWRQRLLIGGHIPKTEKTNLQ